MPKKSPVREYRNIKLDHNDPGYINRILIATPTAGNVRIEWVQARYGQTVPVNWSQVQINQFMNSYIPIKYEVGHAQNLIVKAALEKDFEWLFLLEDDVLLPPDAFIRLNRWMKDEKHPVVSGLYFSRSEPSEPMIFRNRGTGAYDDFKQGDLVWADGIPTGCLLIHMGVLRAMWEDAEEYAFRGTTTRRIFNTPRQLHIDPETGSVNAVSGTSDLDWCTRLIEGEYLAKAGWKDHQKKKYPLLVDTNIFCNHIDRDTGVQYPRWSKRMA